MKIKLAATLGYCLGVRRAIDLTFKHLASRGGRPVYSHGPLIHNRPALKLLEEKGLKLWNDGPAGEVIIRAHGLPPKELDKLNRPGVSICDATCPRVLRIHKLVAREAARGRGIIIWGGADHPEVIGIVGHAGSLGRVISGPEEVFELPNWAEVVLVSQTTQDLARWPEIVSAVRRRWPQAIIKNTICEATEARQNDVATLAEFVDALVVIGGKTSGNTLRLAEIGRRKGLKTLLVEDLDDLDPAWFAGVKTVGISSGASTSTWQIRQVLEAVRALGRNQEISFKSFGQRILRASVLSNIYTGLAIGAVSQTAGFLAGLSQPPIIYLSLFFFYVAALHPLRDFMKGQTTRFSDPDRMAFFKKYRCPLIAFGLTSALLAGFAAWLTGPNVCVLLGLTGLMAIIYSFWPRQVKRRPFMESLAGSLFMPVLLGLLWGGLLTLPPFLSSPPLLRFEMGAYLPFFMVFLYIFFNFMVIVVMEDVLALQGDRIFGRATLPNLYGEKTTKRFLKIALGCWALLLVLGWVSGIWPAWALWLILTGPVYLFFLLGPLFRNAGLYGFYFEAVLYGQFLLSGLAAMAWWGLQP